MDHGVTISMTQSGDPTGSPGDENAMAERLFWTLKGDFEIRGFITFSAAYEAVEKAINNYNAMRSHASLGYLTPHQAHYRTGLLPLKWYPYKKIRFGNVQYPDHYQKNRLTVNLFR
jgi:putative transposase